MQSREHNYYVYIMTNRSKTLYTGITNNLVRRVWEHKQGAGSDFCTKYKLDRLVYFERFQYVGNAHRPKYFPPPSVCSSYRYSDIGASLCD